MQDKYIVNEADLERYPELSECGVSAGDEVEWNSLFVSGQAWPRDVGQEVMGLVFREGKQSQ